jgi:hypothetical protein
MTVNRQQPKVKGLRVNRLAAGSYSWRVAVEPADGSPEERQCAKETALALCRELEAALEGSGAAGHRDPAVEEQG